MAATTPAPRHRQKSPNTVLLGGSSFGIGRHGMPPRRTLGEAARTEDQGVQPNALTISRNGQDGGRPLSAGAGGIGSMIPHSASVRSVS